MEGVINNNKKKKSATHEVFEYFLKIIILWDIDTWSIWVFFKNNYLVRYRFQLYQYVHVQTQVAIVEVNSVLHATPNLLQSWWALKVNEFKIVSVINQALEKNDFTLKMLKRLN
jgi:hypothetical protein